MYIKIEGKQRKIKIVHDRVYRDATSEEYELFKRKSVALPNGGTTYVFVENDEGNIIEDAYARCSMKDTYSKKYGVMLATGRLLKKLRLDTKLALK